MEKKDAGGSEKDGKYGRALKISSKIPLKIPCSSESGMT